MKTTGRFIILVLFIFGGLVAATHAAAAEVEARLDRNQVSLGETVQLIIRAEGRHSGGPDTAPLDKDFQILGTSSGSSINIVNGSMSSTTTWRFTIQPKREGTLTIPPLDIDGHRTEPLTLTVTSLPAPRAEADADIFIESEVVPAAPYERQQVLYQVRLFHAVRLAEGRLAVPPPENTTVQQLGEDRTYETTIGNRRYAVIERTYALFPQQPGTLAIAPPVFEGKVVEKNQRDPRDPFFGNDPFFGRDPFGMFSAATRPVRVAGNNTTLIVRPRPAGTGAAWLPADAVELAEQWQPDRDTARVGEAVTRTVTVTAVGQDGASIPELAPGRMDGVRVYPDKAEVTSDTQSGRVTGVRREKIAFIPVRPGSLTLPAVNLAWWDVKEERLREVSLPARTITILPGEGQFAAAVPPGRAESSEETGSPARGSEQAKSAAGGTPDGRFPWPLVSVGLGAGWLFTMLLWSRDRRKWRTKKGAPAGVRAPHSPSAADPRREVIGACKGGDAARARRGLLSWAAQAWPHQPPQGLSDLASRLEDPEAAAAVAALDRFLFSGRPEQWDGRQLLSVLPKLSEADRLAPPREAPLPPLYPPFK